MPAIAIAIAIALGVGIEGRYDAIDIHRGGTLLQPCSSSPLYLGICQPSASSRT